MQTREEWEQQLMNEGYSHLRFREDPPGSYYKDHVHSEVTDHVILEGEMRLSMRGQTYLLKAGDRIEVPRGRSHSAEVGSQGCKYLTAEK